MMFRVCAEWRVILHGQPSVWGQNLTKIVELVHHGLMRYQTLQRLKPCVIVRECSITHPTHHVTSHFSGQHLSNDDCLQDKREDYPICSVLCCVRQLCTVICTREQLIKLTVGLGLDFLGFRLVFCVFFAIFSFLVSFVVLGYFSSVICQEIG